MLSPIYQPALHGSLPRWSSTSTSPPAPVQLCLRASRQRVGGATNESERPNDLWRPKQNGGHVGDTATLCDATEMDSVRSSTTTKKKPVKDVWRSTTKKEGVGAGASESPVDDKKRNHPVLAENLFAEKLGISASSPTPRKSPSSGKDGPSLQSLGHSSKSRKRLYLVDVHPLCYNGTKVQPRKLLDWMYLLFSDVTRDDPIVAVMDGERGNEYRRALLPSYKSHRNVFTPLPPAGRGFSSCAAQDIRKALPFLHGFFALCQIPVVKQEFAEADDVIATLARQARERGFQVVVASPDMDFQQLLAAEVHMLLPVPELGRWSFYTREQYVRQNGVAPGVGLGVKCMLGDGSDHVPGLAGVAPGFGRKTAMKLMQRHGGSVEEVLEAAAARTVGRERVQEALTQHAEMVRRNLRVLTLRTDVGVELEEGWCRPRWGGNDRLALEMLEERLQKVGDG